MGQGTSACHADVIDILHVRRLAPEAFDKFIKVLTKQDVTLEDFAEQYQCEDCQNDKVLKAWNELAEAFAEATMQKDTSHLALGIAYHDKEEEGDGYDEVNGAFFTVDGVYGLTSAGKKFNKFITRKHYTQWG